MASAPPENLKIIHFDGEVLPHWAQLLDLAASLCPLSEAARKWFWALTNAKGRDNSIPAHDARNHCEELRCQLSEYKRDILGELAKHPLDDQPKTTLAAWTYALDTIILNSQGKELCSWYVEGLEGADDDSDFSDEGDIQLRRV
jgi:hypothetical protein